MTADPRDDLGRSGPIAANLAMRAFRPPVAETTRLDRFLDFVFVRFDPEPLGTAQAGAEMPA